MKHNSTIFSEDSGVNFRSSIYNLINRQNEFKFFKTSYTILKKVFSYYTKKSKGDKK